MNQLRLNNGTTVDVRWNMNALEQFQVATGKELSDLMGKNYGLLKAAAWAAITEGERIAGRTFPLSVIETGEVLDMIQLIEFSKILSSEISSGFEQKKSQPPVKGPTIHTRKIP